MLHIVLKFENNLTFKNNMIKCKAYHKLFSLYIY